MDKKSRFSLVFVTSCKKAVNVSFVRDDFTSAQCLSVNKVWIRAELHLILCQGSKKSSSLSKISAVRANHSRIGYKNQLVLKILLYQTANIKTSSILSGKAAPFFRRRPEVTLHSSRVGRIMGRMCGNPMTAGQEYISYKRKTVRAYYPSDTVSFNTLPIREDGKSCLLHKPSGGQNLHHPRQRWLIFIIVLIEVLILLLIFVLHVGCRSLHPGAAVVRSIRAWRDAVAEWSENDLL